jgi:hypothetical protein
MYNCTPIRTLLSIFFIACSFTSHSEDTLSYKAPAAILIQLNSEHNRLAIMARRKDRKAIAEVNHDIEEVRKRMFYDFKMNFHSCPVYYYIDTNAELVKSKKFDGILMNADSTPVNKPMINSGSTNYYIVYYGYFAQGKPGVAVKDTSINSQEPTRGKGLVVLNDKYQQVDHFYKMGYDDLFYSLRKKKYRNKKIYYNSKHYDIEYYSFASQLNELLSGEHTTRRTKMPSGSTNIK